MPKEIHLWAARSVGAHRDIRAMRQPTPDKIRILQGKLYRKAKAEPSLVSVTLTGGSSGARAQGGRWPRGEGGNESPKTRLGTETTLGLPQAVETRIARNGSCRVCVNMLLTTATTRPSQSSTGAPEAP